MIEVRKTTTYRGPNLWARMPVILMVVDIGELEERPTNKIPGFYEHLTELIPPGTEVRLVHDVDPEDRFERTLAYVERVSDDLDVGLAMARDGFALQLTVPPNVDRVEQIGDAVAEARDDGRGLWSAC